MTVSVRDLTSLWTNLLQPIGLLPDIDRRVRAIEQLLVEIGATMATQADIDALTALLQAEDSQLNTAVGNLTTAVTGIAAEIAALQQQNPQLDLSGLQTELTNSQAAAAQIQTAVASAAALVPASG
jgi:prefoldin subunit 5